MNALALSIALASINTSDPVSILIWAVVLFIVVVLILKLVDRV